MDKLKRVMALCLFCTVKFSPVSNEAKIKVPSAIEALMTSCVVIPCSFKPDEENFDTSSLKGIWYRQKKSEEKEVVYDEDKTRADESFRGRTQLLGHLGQNNCTLEMLTIADHDEGLYCFTMDSQDRQSNCIKLNIRYQAAKPLMSTFNQAVEHQPYTLTCSVTHTCPSNAPQLTWNREQAEEMHRPCVQGYCEIVSILTIIPREADDHSEVVCTATFKGGLTSSASHKLYVKRKQSYNYIIIPAAVAIVTAAVFGVFCFFVVRRYKRRITELQSQEGSMWNRLARLSRRIHTDFGGPARHNPRHSDVNLASSNNKTFSKPRFPSPKSQRTFESNQKEQHDDDDDDEYVNTADLNIYGNL